MRRKLVEMPCRQARRGSYTDPIMEKFAELTQEPFGTLCVVPAWTSRRGHWSRPSLTPTGRTRSESIFDSRNGWTEDELAEAPLHLFGYIGAPLAREALIAAKEVPRKCVEQS
jgi:4-carboxymuconolactone decarboxylase